MCETAVIIPVYKNDDLTIFNKSVNSILSQTYDNYKLFIAVDGPLNSNMYDFLSKIKISNDIEILKYDKNKGLAAVLNNAIRLCKEKKYEYIVRMDADDISLPQRLEKQIEYLKKNTDVDVLGAQAYIIDSNDNVYGKKNASQLINYRVLKRKCDIIHPTVVFRSSFFDVVGYYDENAVLSEDYDLWFRADGKAIKIVSLKDRLLYFRFDINNIKRRKKAQKEIIKVKVKYLKIYDYLYLIPHFLVKISPNFLLKLLINRSIRLNE